MGNCIFDDLLHQDRRNVVLADNFGKGFRAILAVQRWHGIKGIEDYARMLGDFCANFLPSMYAPPLAPPYPRGRNLPTPKNQQLASKEINKECNNDGRYFCCKIPIISKCLCEERGMECEERNQNLVYCPCKCI